MHSKDMGNSGHDHHQDDHEHGGNPAPPGMLSLRLVREVLARTKSQAFVSRLIRPFCHVDELATVARQGVLKSQWPMIDVFRSMCLSNVPDDPVDDRLFRFSGPQEPTDPDPAFERQAPYQKFYLDSLVDVSIATIMLRADARDAATGTDDLIERLKVNARWLDALSGLDDDTAAALPAAFFSLEGQGEVPGELLARCRQSGEFADAIDRFRARLADGNPVEEWIGLTRSEHLNSLLSEVVQQNTSEETVFEICFSEPVDLNSQDDLFVLPFGLPVPAPQLSATRTARISVAHSFGTGPTCFAKRHDNADELKRLKQALAEWHDEFGGALLETFRSHGIPVVPGERLRHTSVVQAYEKDRFWDVFFVTDANEVVSDDEDLPAELEWRASGRDGAEVELLHDGQVVRSALPLRGSVPLDPLWQLDRLTVRLRTDDEPGEEALPDYVPFNEIIYLSQIGVGRRGSFDRYEDLYLSIGPHDGWNFAVAGSPSPKKWTGLPAVLNFEITPAAHEDLTFKVTSSARRLRILTPEIKIQKGGIRTEFFFQPLEPGEPGDPVEVTISQIPDSSGAVLVPEATVRVWIEPEGGRWRVLGDTDVLAVHNALLPDGRCLFFTPQVTLPGGPRRNANDMTRMDAGLFDPTGGSPLTATVPPLRKNLFCAGHAHLPDGRLLLVGGHTVRTQITSGWDYALLPLALLLRFGEFLGELVQSGGTSTSTQDRRVFVFDHNRPRNPWRQMRNMKSGRWYPTVTAMSDGKMLITSGSVGPLAPLNGGNVNFLFEADRKHEFFDPKTMKLVDPPAIERELLTDRDFATYPGVFLLPKGPGRPNEEGTVIIVDRDRAHLYRYDSHVPRLRRSGSATYLNTTGAERTFPSYGAPVLLSVGHGIRTARILVVGGGSEVSKRLKSTRMSSDTAEMFEFNPRRSLRRQGGWSRTFRLAKRRVMPDAVLLPDGTVFVCGGAQTGYGNENAGVVNEAELFDPDMGQAGAFRPMDIAKTAEGRRYHSTALLLPDGTVLSAGSTGGFGAGQEQVNMALEKWEPPYLWRGAAPSIRSAPDLVEHGERFRIGISELKPEEVHEVVMMRLGSVTHGMNMDQRRVVLEILPASDGYIREVEGAGGDRKVIVNGLHIVAPPDGSVAPPGPYMLFLVKKVAPGKVIPSSGRQIRLQSKREPNSGIVAP